MAMSEHEVRIAIKARDEASATLQKTEQGLGSLRGALVRFGGAWLAIQAVRVGLEGVKVAQAGAAREAALASGDYRKIVDAQVAYHDSVRSLMGSIPILGSTLASLVDVFAAGDKALRESAESIDGWRKAAEAAAAAAQKWAREGVLLGARTPGEREALRGLQEAEDIAAAVEAARRAAEEAQARADAMHADIARREAAMKMGAPGYKEAKFRPEKLVAAAAAAEAAELARQAASMEEAARERSRQAAERARREAQEDREKGYAEQTREAERMRAAAEEKDRVLADLDYRREAAGLEGRERELAAVDRHYAEERARWQANADVLAALQDTWAAERAAVVGQYAKREAEEHRRAAEARNQVLEGLQDELFARTASAQEVALRRWGRRLEDLREQFKGDPEVLALLDELRAAGPARDRAGRGAGGAPLLAARFLRGAPGDDPVQRKLDASNAHLGRLVRQGEEAARDRRAKPEAPTVQLAAAEE